MVDTDSYFASWPVEELAKNLLEKVDQYDRYLETSGFRALWRRMSDTYYRGVSQSFLEEVGENGEYLSVHIGHLRNLLKHVHITTTSARPAFEPEAANTDYESRAQVEVCSGLLDYYFVEKKFEKHINRCTENTIVYGESFLSEEWDDSLGDIVDVVETEAEVDGQMQVVKRPIYAGDVRLEVHSPHDVIRDVTKETFDLQQWLVVRKTRNRWDLIARSPDKRAEILELPAASANRRYDQRLSPVRLQNSKNEALDDVDFYVFYHNRTPAMPLGRVVEFLENDVVISDRTMEAAGYKKMPIYRESAGDIEGAPFGYTSGFDLLALSDLCNLLYSTVATNQSNFGVQSIQCPVGSTVKATKITKGLTLFEYASTGKLEPLQLTSTPEEIFRFIEMVEKLLETLSGVNSVARGNPEASLKSGAALALVQSQHIEYTKDLQLSYAGLNVEVGTGLVELFKSHAKSPRLAAIAGRAGRTHLKQLQGSDISQINRVTVNMGNHLTRTPAGRYNIAELLVQSGLPMTPEQLITVLTTGKLEALTRGPQATLDLIQSENEEMLNGEAPAALITDNHVLHIQEHAVIGADVEARKNELVMRSLAAHTMEHIRMLSEMPPELAAILKQPAIAPPQGAPGQTPPPAGAPGAEQPASSPAGGGAPQAAEIPTGSGGVAFPKNPLTGARWNPADGGLSQPT